MPRSAALASLSETRRDRLLRNPGIRIALALLMIGIPFAIVAIPFNLYVSDKILKKAGALLLAVIILGAYRTYVNVVERRSATELSRTHAIREVGAGLLLGALLLSTTIGILAVLGVYQIAGANGWRAMVATLPGFILAAALEEVVMRGVLFRVLEQSLGSWTALAVSAALFGLLHVFNPGATLVSAAAVMVEAGILLAAAYMLTRSLWFCIGIHLAWNFTEGGVFSAAVSGGVTNGLMQARLVGPVWLTGGAFGIETSVVAVVICVAAGLSLLIFARKEGHVIAASWPRSQAAAPAS